MKIVLDSCLLLAFLRQEKNWQKVKNYFLEAKKGKHEIFLCWINLVEVYYKIHRMKGLAVADKTLSLIKKLPLKLVLPDEELYLETARIKGSCAIALADCFITALACRLKAVVLTGDPEFKKVSKIVKIVWLKK